MRGHANVELWGKGYEDRLKNNGGREVTEKLEKAFWESYEPNKLFDDADKSQAYMGHFPHGATSGYILDHLSQIYKES